MANTDFIKEIAGDAQQIYKKHRILASLIIAQGSLRNDQGCENTVLFIYLLGIAGNLFNKICIRHINRLPYK